MLSTVVNRLECEKCGVTFRKQIYIIKHQKRQNAFDPFVQNKSDSEPKQVKQLETASNLESNSEPEVWDKDPDIQLEEGITSDKKDLTIRRVIRKTTKPLPVFAPKKVKTATESYAESKARKTSFERAEKYVSKEKELNLSKTETPIFLSVVYSLFPKAFYVYLKMFKQIV